MKTHFPPEYCLFDDAAREFVINKPDTPRPWENRLWNNLLSVQINNHGGGKVVERDLKERFYVYNSSTHRGVYILDKDSGDLWSPGWLPVRADLDHYEARHGMNYTVINAGRNRVDVKWINTVHAIEACELWRITVTNHSPSLRRLLVVPFYELGLSFRDPYFHGSPDLFKARWKDDEDLFYIKNYSRKRDGERYALAYKSSNPVSGFELSTEGFLRHYGTLQRPEVIVRDDFSNSLPDRLPPVFAMRYELLLMPGTSESITVQLFSAESFEEAEMRSRVLGRRGITMESLAMHRESSVRFFSENNVNTGDVILDRFVNLWTKQQLRYNMFWNREEYGIGMRDSMQDCDSFIFMDPNRCRERILEATRHIYADGHTVRKWARLDLKHYFDGGIWYVNTVCKYLRETGDTSLLEEVEPFFESDESGCLLQHMKRAMDFLNDKRGPDGLCRMGFGDWNDALNGVDRDGRGQSVWTSMAYVWALRSFVELLEFVNDPACKHYKKALKDMVSLINRTCYEKDRYIRAITDSGKRVGSVSCEEGKLYLNPQSWAMIAGIADKRKANGILKTVQKHLYTDFGPVLLHPVYTSHREDIGRITSDPPGYVENGANYVHAAMFHAYGLILAGFPDQALRVVHSVLPSNPKNPVEYSGLEPYMITNAYEGPASKHPGRAMFPWRTGSAGWLLKVVWDAFLGILPGFDGLVIKPSLPASWNDVVIADRKVRGKRMRIVMLKGEGVYQDTIDFTVSPGQIIEYSCIREAMTICVNLKEAPTASNSVAAVHLSTQ